MIRIAKSSVPACRVPVLLLAVVCAGLLAPPSPGKEKQTVTVSYVVAPEKSLPPKIKAVAVIDSGVDSNEESGDAREKKWSTIAADLVESMLQSTDGRHEGAPKIVQRRATKAILAEQDLQLVGIVEGDAAARAGKLLQVDGLAMSRINIGVAIEKNRKSEIDWMGILGGMPGARPAQPPGGPRRPGPAPRHANPYRNPGGPSAMPFSIPQRQIEEVSRHLTVQCSFVLVDAETGESVIQFASPIVQKTDKTRPNFLFGSCVAEADLDPVDYFIGELIERAARDFVGQMVPVRVSQTYEVIGRGKEGERGVRALRADDYAGALEAFIAAHAKKPKEPDTVFALGVTCELMGDYEKALSYYRQVASMEDVDEDDELPIYLAAKDRLAAHLGRISKVEGKRE